MKNKKLTWLISQLLIFVAIIIISLPFVEIALRNISKHLNIYSIEMLKYAIELKMKDPLEKLSHVHIPGRSSHLMGVDISLNSLGNRGLEIPTTDKELKKVLVLGGSGTLGWGVPFDKIFTTLVENRLNTEKPFGERFQFYFANAGVGNYNLQDSIELGIRQIPLIQPCLVIVHFGLGFALPKYSNGQSPEITRYSYLAAFLYEKIVANFLLVQGKTVSKNVNEFYLGSHSQWHSSLQLVKKTRDLLKKSNIGFLIMFTPELRDLSQESPYQSIYRLVLSDFNSRDIKVVEMISQIENEFRGHEELLHVQKDDIHSNSIVHKMMADILYWFLVESNLFYNQPITSSIK